MSQTSTRAMWPGFILCATISVISFATWMAYRPISALMWAFIYSIIIANLIPLPERFSPGIDFCRGDLLRGCIATLGLTVSALVWFQVGWGLLAALSVVFSAFFISIWMARKLGLSASLASLIGIGTSICGASAIAALGPAIRARDEEMGLALGCITLFGLAAMFSYPWLYLNTALGSWLGNDPRAYAIWVGSGIHETAQVIAASTALSHELIGSALMVKSIRIFMIGPMVIIGVGLYAKLTKSSNIGSSTVKLAPPAFAIAFVLNSIFSMLLDAHSAQLKLAGFDWISIKSTLSGAILPFLLATSFAGVGFRVRAADIAKLGIRPFMVGLSAALLAGLISLGMSVMISSYGL